MLPASLFAPTPKATQRVLEFFTAQINNDHTRKSYLNAARRFAEWCELHRLQQLADVQPFHVAAFVRDMQGHFSPPTVKQHLAAIRSCSTFDWLVTGQRPVATSHAPGPIAPGYQPVLGRRTDDAKEPSKQGFDDRLGSGGTGNFARVNGHGWHPGIRHATVRRTNVDP